MSLFSRLFGKAPPTPVTPEKSAVEVDTPVPESVPVRRRDVEAEEQALQSALDSQDVNAVARYVLEGSSTKVRQLAARAIDDPEAIRRLIKEVRGGKDKTVYRILTAKRDVLLEETRKSEQLHAEIHAACAALERHSHRHYDALFTPTLEQLETRWKGLAAQADPEISRRAQRFIDAGREVVAEHLRQVAVVASRELAAANAAAEAQRVRELAEKAAAAAAAERAAALEAQRREEAARKEAQALAIRQIGGLVRKAQAALRDGTTGRAAGIRRAIEEKLQGAPPMPAHLTNQIQQLDTRLNELKDWKSFSVAPKRVELMEEMESLVDSGLEPQVLANRIKSLQEQWRTLSKGAGENLESDWHRFQEAARKAYQPCKDYFESQSLVRQDNLQKREALVVRLEAFDSGHDWENPDWRTVSLALRESRQIWRQHSPVDRAAGKVLQERFEGLIGRLQGRLDAEHARNVREKRSLIERAGHLRSLEDSRAAIEDLKELQRRWKLIGPVAREDDRSLWEEFRQHCDAVFERRQQESAEFAASLIANRSKAIALCEELESIAGLSGPELLAKAQTLAATRQAFESIGPFPKADSRDLHRRFDRAADRIETAMDQQRIQDIERGWTDLLDAANSVRSYRLALLQPEPTRQEELKQLAQSAVDSLHHTPKGAVDCLRRGLSAQGATDLAANEAALRMLCIRAEILTDLPTPPEDQSLRRQYQVQRLVQSMGQGVGNEEGQLNALTIEWVGVGPVSDGPYADLLSRFLRCRKQGAVIPLSGDGVRLNR